MSKAFTSGTLNGSIKFYEKTISAAYGDSILTKEHQEELVKKMRSGDRAARDELILRNWKLVCKCVSSINLPDAEFDDMLQDGFIRFLEICEKFSPEKAALSTFLWMAVSQHVLRANLKVPERIYKFSKSLRDAVQVLSEKNQRNPSVAELAVYLGLTEEKFTERIQKVEHSRMISLDASIESDSDSENEGADLYNLFKSDEFSPEEQFMQNENISLIRKAISKLSDREQKVMTLRNNLNNSTDGCLSLREIGVRLNLSYETVRKAETSAKLKLRRILNREGFSENCLAA